MESGLDNQFKDKSLIQHCIGEVPHKEAILRIPQTTENLLVLSWRDESHRDKLWQETQGRSISARMPNTSKQDSGTWEGTALQAV